MKITSYCIGSNLKDIPYTELPYLRVGNKVTILGNEISNFLETQPLLIEIIIDPSTNTINVIRLIFSITDKDIILKNLDKYIKLEDSVKFGSQIDLQNILDQNTDNQLFIEQWQLENDVLLNYVIVQDDIIKIEIFKKEIS